MKKIILFLTLIILIISCQSKEEINFLEKAWEYADQRLYKDAISYLEKNVSESRRSGEFYYLIGVYQLSENEKSNARKALESFQRAYELASNDFYIICSLAYTYLLIGDKSNSIKYYKESLKYYSSTESNTIDPYYELALLYYQLNNMNEASENIKLSPSFEKNDTLSILLNSRIQARNGNIKQLYLTYEKLINENKVDENVQMIYADTLVELQLYEKAKNNYLDLIKKKFNIAEVYSKLSIIALLEEDYELAKMNMDKANQINSLNLIVLQNYVFYLYKLKLYTDACDKFVTYRVISENLYFLKNNNNVSDIENYFNNNIIFDLLNKPISSNTTNKPKGSDHTD